MAKLHRVRPRLREAYSRNWSNSRQPDFVRSMAAWFRCNRPDLFRIHVDGDFYASEYIIKWANICAHAPDTRFVAYTRSWLVNSLRPALRRLKALPNVNLFLSTDPTTPKPPRRWLTAGVSEKLTDVTCPRYTAAPTITCRQCQQCYGKRPHSVVFKVH